VPGAFRPSASPAFLDAGSDQCLNLVYWFGPGAAIGSY